MNCNTTHYRANSSSVPGDPTLALIAIATYALLCVAFINATPYRSPGRLLSRMQSQWQGDIGAPDERQHSNYVRGLAGGFGFPIFKPNSPDLYENYQAHQPPLYYILAAPFAAPLATNDGFQKWSLRLVNVLLGGICIWLIFTGIRRFTGNEDIALFAACFAAFLPMFVAIGSAVTNDMLLYVMAALVMNVIAAGWDNGWDLKQCLLLGCVLGLGLLTKTSAALLFPVALLGLLMRNRPKVLNIGACFLVALVIASPWLIRNQILYGDPLAIGAFRQASVGNLPASVAIQELGGWTYWFSWVGASAVKSFWGVFGYFDIYLPDAMYRVLSAAAVACLAGLLLGKREDKRFGWLCMALFAAVLAGFISYNINYYQAQARYLYPAIFAITAAIASGLWRLTRGNAKTFWSAAGLWLVALVAIDCYVAFSLLPHAFEWATVVE